MALLNTALVEWWGWDEKLPLFHQSNEVCSYGLTFGQSQTYVGVIIENTACKLVTLTVITVT